MTEIQSSYKQLSWRDPAGFVVSVEGRILRAVDQQNAGQVRALLARPMGRRFDRFGCASVDLGMLRCTGNRATRH